ncbi:hypothetical protein RHSIM_Rhsim06G0114700 [Rhododendron simsii]|uniref:Uncharacterized protein n=1 Tax=Rhododendron simsii TaxID=118357 RepID=A0A834GUQ2_RHOSS|nr:hypothetical protein RHSIM_Rhsim06G0114700 [Rhododendron simsii]
MNQPINLSSLLSRPGHGRGRGATRGQGSDQGRKGSQGHGLRAAAHSDAPPGFSPEEIPTGHPDKRPYSHNADAEDTALALSQAFLLPGDTQKEVEYSLNKLLSSFMINSAKAMQKMVAIAEKLGLAKPQRAKLANENAQLQCSITWLERERNQARTAAEDLKSKFDGTEDNLNQALTELETSKAESKSVYQQGYNEGINTATENYKAQMPIIQDEVWAATWAACLKKAGVLETSPLWAENNLPSTVAMPEEDFEASGGNNADSTVAEVNTVQATLAPIQDLTLEG